MKPLTDRPTFSGWRILALATLTAALTGPGQTIGVSVFIDPLIEDLALTRSQVSTAYLIGTMTAALGLPLIGQQIDRIGVRRAMTLIGLAFGAALVGMSGVQGFVTLTLGFVGIRMFGQGSLSLVSTVAVTHWFERRRGTALGLFSTGTSILMSLVPVGLSLVIEAYDWRAAWLTSAVLIWFLVIPIARYGLIDRPADVGQLPDGARPTGQRTAPTPRRSSMTRGEALRTGRFWVLVAASMSVGMLSTALNFHQISLLGDAGLTATEAAIMFLPQVIGAAIAGVVFGYLSDRLTGRVLIPMSMSLLAASLLLAANLSPGILIVLYAVTLGSAGGASRSVSATLLPRWFGTRHIGAVQGTATFLNVASTALGPVAFSIARDAAGNYEAAAFWFSVLPLLAGIAALAIKSVRVDTLT
ncbi:MAG: MFS transporter [Acidimicrobiia bacterium]|nr:MFS transporter [Acidimicrobiia bacterium]NNF68693.1 MFS transporter [Acidimicrobiia bacterium]NNK91574.1 MFS transporter [Acidimicrobiia bacterium]